MTGFATEIPVRRPRSRSAISAIAITDKVRPNVCPVWPARSDSARPGVVKRCTGGLSRAGTSQSLVFTPQLRWAETALLPSPATRGLVVSPGWPGLHYWSDGAGGWRLEIGGRAGQQTPPSHHHLHYYHHHHHHHHHHYRHHDNTTALQQSSPLLLDNGNLARNTEWPDREARVADNPWPAIVIQ